MSGVSKIKKVNFPIKNKSKNYIGLNMCEQKNIYPFLKNQARQIICFFGVSRYNFNILKKYSSNLLVDKIKSNAALRFLKLLLGLSHILPESKLFVKKLLVFPNKL